MFKRGKEEALKNKREGLISHLLSARFSSSAGQNRQTFYGFRIHATYMPESAVWE